MYRITRKYQYFYYSFVASLLYQINKLVEENNLFERDALGEPQKLTPLAKTLIHYLKQQMPLQWGNIRLFYNKGELLLTFAIEEKIKASKSFLSSLGK